MSSTQHVGRKQETFERLLTYSAAAGLGAFAYGQQSEAVIIHTDIADLQINRGDPALTIDFDNDGYTDVTLLNTTGGGFGYGNIMWRGSYYSQGPAGGDPLYPNRGAGYSVTNTKFGNDYYVRSFEPGDLIGPSNSYAVDIRTPFYGLVSNYAAYGNHSFMDPSANYPNPEYAGFRFVDGNGDNRYGWARFQITVHDVVNGLGLPIPDGIIDARDYQSDPNKYVTIFEYAYESTPDLDIAAGDVGSALEGDLNNDGFVGIGDLNIVLGEWNTDASGDPRADVSGDNFVGIEDLNAVLGNWNAGTPPAVNAVPEPTSLAMLAAGGGALAFSRRRKTR